MTTLILGATGATGRHVLTRLLDRGEDVRVIVRSIDRLPEASRDHPQLTVIEAAVLDLSDSALEEAVAGCSAVVSCLGHNLTFRGIYGKPRRLVTDATRRVCESIAQIAPAKKVRFCLMNTTGNHFARRDSPRNWRTRAVVGMLRWLLPPHVDNEQAAAYLCDSIGTEHPHIEWTVIRPDGLTDEDTVTPWSVHPSPTRNPIFDAGQTSRNNVAAFIVNLLQDDALFAQWQGEMPVLYNAASVPVVTAPDQWSCADSRASS